MHYDEGSPTLIHVKIDSVRPLGGATDPAAAAAAAAADFPKIISIDGAPPTPAPTVRRRCRLNTSSLIPRVEKLLDFSTV